MKRKSLKNVDLAMILKNANVESTNIECLYDNKIKHVVDAHYGDSEACYLLDNEGVAVLKSDCCPTKKGWKKIKELKKLANNLCPFKKGEWILHRATVAQIQKIQYGLIQEVSDGFFNSASYSLNDYCFKLTCDTKRISENFNHILKQAYNSNVENVVYPNVYKIFIEIWKQMMINTIDNKEEKNESLFRELEYIVKGITGQANWRLKEYGGLNLISCEKSGDSKIQAQIADRAE